MKTIVCNSWLATALLLLYFVAVALRCNATIHHFEDWTPLQTVTDSVRISTNDISILVPSDTDGLEQHMKFIALRSMSRSSTDDINWPPKMRLNGAGLKTLLPNEEQHYVQFATRVNDVTAAVFESFTGRPLLSMVADRAFVAIGSRTWMTRAQAFPGVVFVTARKSTSKVAPGLSALLHKNTLDRDKSKHSSSVDDSIHFLAACYGAVGCQDARARLRGLGCQIYEHNSRLLELQCSTLSAPHAVQTCISSPGVHWVEPKPKNLPLNWKGKSLVSTGKTQAFNGQTQTNPSKVIASIRLSGSSVIGLADTGITRQNCYFCSSTEGISCYNRAATTDSSRNIFAYWFSGPDLCAQCGRCGNVAVGSSEAQGCGNHFDESGHGTHVAATIVGSSDQATSPDSVRNNGIAGAIGNPTSTSAGAKLFFQDVLNNSSSAECTAAGLRSDCGRSMSLPTALENLFVDPYTMGVRVHSNSWGCVRDLNSSSSILDSCDTYNSQARDIDAFNTEGSARIRQDFLVVVAAGNDGLKTSDRTVGAPSTCKNCLVVGASESNADQWAADSVYVSPNMFCTGNLKPRSCCTGIARGSCSTIDCCEAAAAATLCYECCNIACLAPNAPSSQNLAAFSSRGPTRDGRLKPDVVAPGASVLSANTLYPVYPLSSNYSGRYCETNPSNPNFDAAQSLQLRHGTSSAAALVAGAAEYVRQYFLQGFYPTGAAVSGDGFAVVPEALLRAVIIAGARQLTGTMRDPNGLPFALPSWYPNFAIGYGLPVLDRALYIKGYAPPFFANGLAVAINSHRSATSPLPVFAADSTTPLLFFFVCGRYTDNEAHVVLTWTDAPGNQASLMQLVNDLDLIVLTPDAQIFGNTIDFPDTQNNVEKVVVSPCIPGATIRIAVNPARLVSAQAFSLVASGNVLSGSGTAMMQLQSGAFTFDTKRPFLLPQLEQRPNLCNIQANAPYKPGNALPLDPQLVAHNALSRFHVALVMALGAPMQVLLVSCLLLQDSSEPFSCQSEIEFSMGCSSYPCMVAGQPSVCWVTGNSVLASLMSNNTQMLFSRLPKTNPLHIVDWSKLKTRAPIISAAAVIEVGFMIMTTIMMLIFGSLLH